MGGEAGIDLWGTGRRRLSDIRITDRYGSMGECVRDPIDGPQLMPEVVTALVRCVQRHLEAGEWGDASVSVCGVIGRELHELPHGPHLGPERAEVVAELVGCHLRGRRGGLAIKTLAIWREKSLTDPDDCD